MSYAYPAEKFSTARQVLTPPHDDGEHVAVVIAFQECRAGLHRMNRSELNETVRSLIYALECFMNTEGVTVPPGGSAWTIKAQALSDDEKAEIRRLVDELAQFFHSQSLAR